MIDPVKYLNTPELRDDVSDFFGSHPIPQAAKTLEQVLERHSVNTRLRTREESRLGEFLTTASQNGSSLMRRFARGRQ